jgi:hypothetical protein
METPDVVVSTEIVSDNCRMETSTILILISWHWLGDFVLQSHDMALNKSKSNKWLAYHVGVYTLTMLVVFGPVFAIINGILHFATDYVTSRKTSQLWADDKTHDFFVWIGLDQAIHMICLVTTASLLGTTQLGYLA